MPSTPPSIPPPPPSRAQAILSLIGLACVLGSLALAFSQPFGLWHWLLLLGALGCLIASRRLTR